MSDQRIERKIGSLLWTFISMHPDCTRNDIYAEYEIFGTKELKRVLKKFDGLHWNCTKTVSHLGYKDYRTEYRYIIKSSDFNKR